MSSPNDLGMKAMVRVSRHQPGLGPGDGEKIGFEVGEEVRVVSGQDKGRCFVITSGPLGHADAPGKLVREGYFADDPQRTVWCKREDSLWPKSEGGELERSMDAEWPLDRLEEWKAYKKAYENRDQQLADAIHAMIYDLGSEHLPEDSCPCLWLAQLHS